MESVILPGNGKAGSLLLDMAIAEVAQNSLCCSFADRSSPDFLNDAAQWHLRA